MGHQQYVAYYLESWDHADRIGHPIADAHPGNISDIVFPGQDYNNARIYDFEDVDKWENNKRESWEISTLSFSFFAPFFPCLNLFSDAPVPFTSRSPSPIFLHLYLLFFHIFLFPFTAASYLLIPSLNER
jgi:hypothetical protein